MVLGLGSAVGSVERWSSDYQAGNDPVSFALRSGIYFNSFNSLNHHWQNDLFLLALN